MTVMWPLEPLGVAQLCSVTSQMTGILYYSAVNTLKGECMPDCTDVLLPSTLDP